MGNTKNAEVEVQSRKRYILYKKLNPSPIYMLLGISDRAKQGVGGKCKKINTKCKNALQETLHVAPKVESIPNLHVALHQPGRSTNGAKKGSVGNANAGTKSKCVALQN